MPTPHIAAEPGDLAPSVLMPGDPRRAQRIAERLMPDARLVTDVRGMLGFTGTVDGRPLSVMGSGMGQPSLTIYATELFSQLGVRRIIRVGTAGGVSRAVRVGDVIVATGAHTDSSMNQVRIPGVSFSAVADFWLARAACEAAQSLGMTLAAGTGAPDLASLGEAGGTSSADRTVEAPGPRQERVHVGTVISRDHFYLTPEGQTERLAAYGVLGAEMEAAALYAVAAELGRQALAVLTVSNHLLDQGTDMSAAERETRFDAALRLAVAAAHSQPPAADQEDADAQAQAHGPQRPGTGASESGRHA